MQKPPFRADHVGSLLRPQDLHEARAKNRRGELSDAELKAIQDRDIREVVKMQESLGLQAITDGEFRRDWWHIDFIHGFDGVDLTVNKQHTFHASDEQPPMFKLTGKVRRTKPSMLSHFQFLKEIVKKGTPKFTMPSPAMLHARSDREPSGGFEPVRYVPKGKKVGLGLVSSKLPQLENQDTLKRRIEAASKFVPFENLCISPQCGFSSTHHGNNLTEEQEKAKLRLC